MERFNLHKTIFKILTLVGFFSFIASSCSEKSPFNSLKGKGKLISEQITVNKFKAIHIYDDLTLILTNDSINCQIVILEGAENLLPNINVESKDGILSIRNSNRMKWLNNYNSGVKIIVSSHLIKEIAMHDAANIQTAQPIFADSLYFKALDASGTANISVYCNFFHVYSPLGMVDVALRGSAQSFYCYNADMGFVNASGLQCEYAHIHDFGVNKLYAPQTHQLGVTIENIGDVYYSGNPVILWYESKSSGKLIHIN